MSTSTTRLGLTKPAAGESYDLDVWNGNMQKIEDKLAAYTWGTRISYGNNSRIDYWRQGFMVCVQVVYHQSDGDVDAWDSKTIGTLPAGYKPASGMLARAVVDRSADEGAMISVESNGAVRISARYNSFNTSGDVAQACICFPAYQ